MLGQTHGSCQPSQPTADNDNPGLIESLQSRGFHTNESQQRRLFHGAGGSGSRGGNHPASMGRSSKRPILRNLLYRWSSSFPGGIADRFLMAVRIEAFRVVAILR